MKKTKNLAKVFGIVIASIIVMSSVASIFAINVVGDQSTSSLLQADKMMEMDDVSSNSDNNSINSNESESNTIRESDVVDKSIDPSESYLKRVEKVEEMRINKSYLPKNFEYSEYPQFGNAYETEDVRDKGVILTETWEGPSDEHTEKRLAYLKENHVDRMSLKREKLKFLDNIGESGMIYTDGKAVNDKDYMFTVGDKMAIVSFRGTDDELTENQRQEIVKQYKNSVVNHLEE